MSVNTGSGRASCVATGAFDHCAVPWPPPPRGCASRSSCTCRRSSAMVRSFSSSCFCSSASSSEGAAPPGAPSAAAAPACGSAARPSVCTAASLVLRRVGGAGSSGYVTRRMRGPAPHTVQERRRSSKSACCPPTLSPAGRLTQLLQGWPSLPGTPPPASWGCCPAPRRRCRHHPRPSICAIPDSSQAPGSACWHQQGGTTASQQQSLVQATRNPAHRCVWPGGGQSLAASCPARPHL